MSFTQSRLTNKLRLSTGVLVLSILLGSFAAYLKMRQVSRFPKALLPIKFPHSRLCAICVLRCLIPRMPLSHTCSSVSTPRWPPVIAPHWKRAGRGERVLEWVQAKRHVLDASAGHGEVDAMLSEYQAFAQGRTEWKPRPLARGSDATSKAYDLLQGQVADHEAACRKASTTVIDATMQTTDHNLSEAVRVIHVEALYLWLSIVFGGVVGTLLAEFTIRRVVRSIVLVANRAQQIAEGDLAGETLHTDSNNEIGSLASSINRMQDNLREMIGTMMEISNIVNDDAEKLAHSSAESFSRMKEHSLQTQQAATAMREMSISISEVSRHAQNAAENAKEASKTARTGGSTVEQMLVSMQSIADSVRNTASTVQRLGKESEQIIRIVN